MRKNKINIKKNRILISVLGEVCYGFQVDDFEEKIGEKQAVVNSFLERLLKSEKSQITEVYIDDAEVEVIKKSFDEVIKEIEDWEFHARLGVFLEEAKALLRQPPFNWQ